jgi:HEAT repeats
MRKRPRILLLLLLVGTAGVVVWRLTPPAEPTCDGRSLTRWMAALGSPDMDEEAHAFAAIQSIGTNGLSVILPLLGKRDSALQSRLSQLTQYVPRLHSHFVAPAERRRKAKLALFLCGEESLRRSVLGLIRLSRDSDPGVRLTAIEILSAFPIGDSAPLPALEAAQTDTDSQVRAAALQAVQQRRAIEHEVQRLRKLWPDQPQGTNSRRASQRSP